MSIACERFDVLGSRKVWGMEDIMGRCDWIPLPKTFPRASALQRGIFAGQVNRTLNSLDAHAVFNTQMSPYMRQGCSIAYHHGDLLYLYGNGGDMRSFYYSIVRRMMR